MVKTNMEWLAMSDKTIVSFIGKYNKKQRLNQNITQAKVAEIVGINHWTLRKIENEKPISLLSLIQILKGLPGLLADELPYKYGD